MILIARPRPIIRGTDRVIRSGSWFSKDRNCRSANRDWAGPSNRYNSLGFRAILRKRG